MSLLTQIRADQLQTRKSKELDPATRKAKVSLLTTLIGEAENIGKSDGNRDTTDSEVLSLIKKFIKNNNETLSHRPTDQGSLFEKEILETYLPAQLSADELIQIINEIVSINSLSSPRDVGVVMKELKANYDGKFDNKIASGVARGMLA